MPKPTLPFWMLQRQIKCEGVADHTLRLAGPNLPTCEVSVLPMPVGQGWRVAVERIEPDGKRTPTAHTEVIFTNMDAAWQAGFELYRQRVIV